MDFTQSFETTIYNPTSGKGVHFYIIPGKFISEAIFENDSDELLESIGLHSIKQFNINHLPEVLTCCIQEYQPERILQDIIADDFADISSDTEFEFANHICSENLIPVVNSPINFSSIPDLLKLAKLESMELATVVNFIVFGNTPLLLLSIPASCILFGLVSGLSHALEEGLRV